MCLGNEGEYRFTTKEVGISLHAKSPCQAAAGTGNKANLNKLVTISFQYYSAPRWRRVEMFRFTLFISSTNDMAEMVAPLSASTLRPYSKV